MRATIGISWALLVALTIILTGALRYVHFPAALMLGPMVSGITVALWRPGAKLPRGTTVVAQAVLGCLIAHAMTPQLLGALLPRWPILLGMNLATLLGIVGLGVVVTRTQWLPGTAGVWGMSPGAASAMVLLSEAYGSDKRLVAVMQYLRLVCAALLVIAIGTVLGEPHKGGGGLLPAAGASWLVPIEPPALGATIALTITGVAASLILRSALLAIFIPVFGGIAVQLFAGVAPQVPPFLTAAAFMVIGWHVGLSFTRATLVYSARLVPRIFVGIVGILLLCVVLALLLSELTGASFVTAYMALNPGGTDAVMAMASSVTVDLPLILAMQLSRLVMVVLLAPMLGRLAASYHLKKVGTIDAASDDQADLLAKQVDEVL